MRAAGSFRTRQSRRSARGTTTATWRRCRRGTAATTRRSQSYATQGSNPRRAGRVSGRSATHTVGPRLGQASLAWTALKPTLVLAPRPAAAPLCDANGRQCVQVLAALWLYLPWSLLRPYHGPHRADALLTMAILAMAVLCACRWSPTTPRTATCTLLGKAPRACPCQYARQGSNPGPADPRQVFYSNA